MSALDRPPRYRSYVLRFWEERGHARDRASTWRFSLEDPHTGQRRGFAGLEEVIAAIRSELDQGGDEPQSRTEPRR
jgi:hypothetical protein